MSLGPGHGRWSAETLHNDVGRSYPDSGHPQSPRARRTIIAHAAAQPRNRRPPRRRHDRM